MSDKGKLKKGLRIISIVVGLVVIAVVGLYIFNKSRECKIPTYSVTVEDILARDKKASEEDYPVIAARLLAERYLDYLTSKEACPKMRIEDFDIDDVDADKIGDTISAESTIEIDMPSTAVAGYGSYWAGSGDTTKIRMDVKTDGRKYTLLKLVAE